MTRPERLVPEAADVDPGHLRGAEHLAQAPHQGPVHPHQLLVVHHVRLVQHDADLVIVTPQRLNTPPELIANVQLVGVKQQQNPETRNQIFTSIFKFTQISLMHVRTSVDFFY